MKEHDVVYITDTIVADGTEIPRGTHGTIVHVYDNGEAFEVEFSLGYGSEVVPVPAKYLKHNNPNYEG